jgi:hypothetical protein
VNGTSSSGCCSFNGRSVLASCSKTPSGLKQKVFRCRAFLEKILNTPGNSSVYEMTSGRQVACLHTAVCSHPRIQSRIAEISNCRRYVWDGVGDKNTECFKKSFTTLKAYIHLLRGHVLCFELS